MTDVDAPSPDEMSSVPLDEPSEAVGADDPRQRSWVPTVLVVVATLIAVVSATTTWVHVQALDTDEWVDTSAQLLEEPEVREALATYLVDELYTEVDVGARLAEVVPDDLSGFAKTLAGALRAPAIDGVERVLDRPRLQQAWEQANRRAHEAFVAIVRNETRDSVSTSDGAVVLDLGDAIVTVGQDLGLPQSALDRVPDDLGQVTVIQSSELADLQEAVRALDVLSWFLFILVVALYVLAVYLARGRRRETLRDVGVALIVGGVAIAALRSVGVRLAVDTIVEEPTNRPVGRLVADVFTQLLLDMATTAAIIGMVIVVYAALLGSHRWAIAFRRRLGRAAHPGPTIAVGAIILVLLLAWWSPGLIFERWITALTLVGSVIAAAIALAASLGAVSDVEPAAPE